MRRRGISTEHRLWQRPQVVEYTKAPNVYYVKPITGESQTGAWDASSARAALDFTSLLHPSQAVHGMTDGQRKALADAAAAAVTQVHRLAPLPPEFISELLNYCHFAVQNVGYSTETLEELEPLLKAGGDNLMVIMGCQTLPLLHARVDAAIRLLRAVGMGFEVVFAGFNPTAGVAPARIINEAKEAHIYFHSLIQNDQALRDRIGLRQWTESQSTDTSGNIRHFLDSDFLTRNGKKRVFLVSSTFHLMRIAVELENYRDDLVSRTVTAVVLVGAENLFAVDAIKCRSAYVRSLAFEVYYDVLKRVQPTPIRATTAIRAGA